MCFHQNSSNYVKRKEKNQVASSHIIYTSADEQFIAIVATLLFVVHPIHTEAVS